PPTFFLILHLSYSSSYFPLAIHFLFLESLFFFFMIRRPPRSTLFPTRRSSDLFPCSPVPLLSRMQPRRSMSSRRLPCFCIVPLRSEEHTSELQSRGHLVCRLLLEKKKQTGHTMTIRTLLFLAG